ncbi:anti-sigma regulatory factor (Ser/Thr protein kinase) [Motilibacter rhizosphaerae]|uniref:Anti-sigma regulatory factor (Ser/Thr protein kinase) n=1 Tax=Motilibacter rhizosphaerae TaxID=598652 RepID=A0A4Q7NBD5_9ACTN|nr:ATP-binding protein [Motilibacter rhizosphaerae]RZS80140.1 anti-sigma regulatory factor (Ser/Thr protein kinase) [Motilibacter rhizosphaerae]
MTADGPPTDPSRHPQYVEVPLPHDLESPRLARTRVEEILASWHLDRLVDPVKLAVSELVTNAVRYGRPPLQVILRRWDNEVLELDVRDADPSPPRHREPDTDTQSGRGLGIVEALANTVEVEQVPEDGKVVRARFALDD